MITDVYSEVMDEDRRLNAERMDQEFYARKDPNPASKNEPEESGKEDEKLLLELLRNLPAETKERLLKMSGTAC